MRNRTSSNAAQRFAAFGLTLAALLALLLMPALTRADIIGTEGFDYADGSIASLNGGTGFDYNNTAAPPAHTGSASTWDSLFGSPTVVSGQLSTANAGALRQYNGPSEGVTSDATPSDERLGAVRGAGVVYYGFDLTRTAGQAGGANNWGGASSYDFTAERLFFGVPGGQGANAKFGVAGDAGTHLSSITAVDNETYHIVTAVDFDNNQVRMWVNPSVGDFDQRGTGNSADVVATYTNNNWSTAVRLASGADAPTLWDNLTVANTFILAAHPNVVFADDFNDPNGTALNAKAADVGGPWSVTTGSPLNVNNGGVDTQGAARVAFADFTSALAEHEQLTFDFETNDTGGNMFSNGFAGISLYAGGSEKIFLGDRSDANSWGLEFNGTGIGGISTNTDESVVGKFIYNYDTGYYALYLNGSRILFGHGTAGLALDRLRIANNGGGDIAVSELAASVTTIPTPAALPAGFGLLGLLGIGRRRNRRSHH